jgi:hypothetical protein
MSMRRIAGLLFAGGLAAGLGAGMTAIAHASDPVRPAQAWNEIFLPFDTGQGNTMCVDAAGARLRLSRCHEPGTRLGRTTGAGVVRSAATTPALPSPDTR